MEEVPDVPVSTSAVVCKNYKTSAVEKRLVLKLPCSAVSVKLGCVEHVTDKTKPVILGLFCAG